MHSPLERFRLVLMALLLLVVLAGAIMLARDHLIE